MSAPAPWPLAKGSTGAPVRPLTDEQLVRIYGVEQACPDCVIGGGLCSDCAAPVPPEPWWLRTIVSTAYLLAIAVLVLGGVLWATGRG